MAPHLTFEASEDRGLSTEQRKARRQKEAASLELFERTTALDIATLDQLHTFLFVEHAAYASGHAATADTAGGTAAAASAAARERELREGSLMGY
mgnify:CR=1 FL=1